MNLGWCLVAPFLALGACSLLHDNLPNDPPTVHLARMTCQSPGAASLDTLINSADAVCRVQRGGEVRFEIRATDEDDDPVFYEWRAPAGGSFRDAQAQETNSWFAPQTIVGSSEQFVVQVLVIDRNCDVVPDLADRQRCAEDARVLIENFLVEVVQREPLLEVTTDVTSAFSVPQIVIDAFGTDPDGDQLEYHWEPIAEDSLSIWSEEAIRDEKTGRQIGSHATVVAFFPGRHKLRVSASDGAANTEREIALHVSIEPPLPAGGTVHIVLPTGQEYEIDAYEYPNSRGERPQSASFFQAARLCAAAGKRLCSPEEWTAACQAGQTRHFSSIDDLAAYDSRDHFGVRFCNVPGSAFSYFSSDPTDQLAPSGSFPNCGSASGVFDLTGNIDEWTAALDDAGDLAVYVAASSVSASGACDGASLVSTLSIEGQDPYDLEVLAEIMADSPLQTYEQPLLGFRCCR
ncbi:MAG: SUMF1/EgtB/PvdO family nonheme iron enzyme [Gemmatimonadota bacterium]|nr:SUMF1/EgtB/PvdO family nonheme iron enzyme [Gemmatimonadota bacterium]